MVRRSHKRRKQFSCGHRGFGKFCHRCLPLLPTVSPVSMDEATASPLPIPRRSKQRRWQSVEPRQAKRQWQASFAHDSIDLTHLPKPIVLKTRRILASLNQGIAPAQLYGKRFMFDRTLLRIPVTYRYRLLCRWQSGRIIPLQVLTHEAYNAIAFFNQYLGFGSNWGARSSRSQ